MTNLYKLFERSTGVSTDSRTVSKGNLYFALKGESFDGNLYAAQALQKGAAYAIVDDPAVADGDKYIIVENVLVALQNLATYHRRVLGIPILAITGTNGKTTTKELLAAVLSERYNVAYTRGNLNNHIGVPLTILSITTDHEFAIVEMGASGRGEIELLCNISQPDFGLITNIGRAHLEGFGSMEGIVRAKGELYDYLASHKGIAFIPKEDATLAGMASKTYNLLHKDFTISCADGITSRLAGDYNKKNIAAAVAIGDYFGVTRSESKKAIENYRPENSRSQLKETDENLLLLDCYNANPSSMGAAIDFFGREESSRDKAVILGDMNELGATALDEHIKILQQLKDNGITEIYLVGRNFMNAAEGTGIPVFETTGQIKEFIESNPLNGKYILIKGSRLNRLEELTDLL